jgi:hypothetical protein
MPFKSKVVSYFPGGGIFDRKEREGMINNGNQIILLAKKLTKEQW